MISLETFGTSRPSNQTVLSERAPLPANSPDFARLLEDFAGRIDGGEALVRNASAGAYLGMDAGQLIALQAGIYRYSEAIELGAKLVDRAASSVRAVLQAGH